MLDVAACAEELLVSVRHPRLESLARTLGLTPEQALPWLLLFVALHDLGKATPSFQAKDAGAKARLAELGYDFPDTHEPHGEMSTVLLPDVLEGLAVPSQLAAIIGRSAGAHHGDQ